MRKAAAVACIMLLVFCGLASAELVKGEATDIPHPILSVTGQGSVEVAPDTVQVTASVFTQGETVELARERNAQIVARATAAVKALNLRGANLRTLNYTLERVTRDANVTLKVDPTKLDIPWTSVGEVMQPDFTISVPITLGYQASNTISVRFQSASPDKLSQAAGRIMDALLQAGANQITGVNFSVEKGEAAATQEALTKAVKDAQATAEVISAASGRKVVGLRSITPTFFRPAPQPPYEFAARAMGGAPTPTTVSAGMLTVSAQVLVNYDLEYNAGDTSFLPAPQ